tara:strand:- start:184 stop:435 length:252 start_codon:yes stop_codon:yes gene_type:complete
MHIKLILGFLHYIFPGGRATALASLPKEAEEFGVAISNVKREFEKVTQDGSPLYKAIASMVNEWADVRQTVEEALGVDRGSVT